MVMHTTTVITYLSTRKIKKLIQAIAPSINTSEAYLLKAQRPTLDQLKTNKSLFLRSHSHKVYASHNPSHCPVRNTQSHDTTHFLYICAHTADSVWICG